MNRIQFFVHEDPDAVRIEVAGSLCGPDAETVYRAWKRAALPNILRGVIVDITFVTDADEYGLALLVVMHRYGARIIAQSPESAAIAQRILAEPIDSSPSKQGWLRRLIRFVREDRPGVGLSAPADIPDTSRANARTGSGENTGLGELRKMEVAVR